MDPDMQKMIFEEISNETSVSLKKKLLKLDLLNNQKITTEENNYEKEFDAMRLDYEAKYNQIYEQIAKIVSGDGDETKRIPNYWKTSIENTGYFECSDKDLEILDKLVEVRKKKVSTGLDFEIEYQFSENQYFPELVLSKKYTYDPKTEQVIKTDCVKPTWNKDCNPTLKNVTKEGKEVETKVASFFDMFVDEDVKTMSECELKEKNSCKINKGCCGPVPENVLYESNEEAGFMKDDFFPYSIEYFLGILDSEEYAKDEA